MEREGCIERQEEALPAFGANEKTLREVHALAFALYSKGAYQQASHGYRLLTLCAPNHSAHWKGLGACLQMLGTYEEALFCYFFSQRLLGKEQDPRLYLHAADCHFALKEREEGLAALDLACAIALERRDLPVLKHGALMRELWSHNRS